MLDPLELTGMVVTFDALLAQTDHAKYLVEEKGAHYLAVLRGNHRRLHALVKELPWKQVPGMDRAWATAHGRDEIRRLKVAAVAGVPFPHADQALQIVRRRRTVRTGKVSIERVYAITSLTAHQATAAEGLRHHGRDMTRPPAALGLT